METNPNNKYTLRNYAQVHKPHKFVFFSRQFLICCRQRNELASGTTRSTVVFSLFFLPHMFYYYYYCYCYCYYFYWHSCCVSGDEECSLGCVVTHRCYLSGLQNTLIIARNFTGLGSTLKSSLQQGEWREGSERERRERRNMGMEGESE